MVEHNDLVKLERKIWQDINTIAQISQDYEAFRENIKQVIEIIKKAEAEENNG